MDFSVSTHKRDWIFTEQQLKERRESAHTSCVNSTRQALLESSPALAESFDPLTLEEEAILRRYYLTKIQELCRSPALQYRPRVQHCAQILFHRFYLGFSIMDHDPTRIFRTIIYFASKVEDTLADKLEEFCQKVKEQQDTVRRYEATIIEGVKYDLYVHTPYRALKGVFQLLGDRCAAAEGGSETAVQQVDASLRALDAAGRLKIHEKANGIVESMMFTDLMLTCPPGQLAAAAFRKACRALGHSGEAFLRAMVGQAAQGTGAQDAAWTSFCAALDKIDAVLEREGAVQLPSLEALKALDLKLKRCRNPLLDPTSEIFKRRMKDKQSERNEKRDRKIAATREAQANDLQAILGDLMPPVQAQAQAQEHAEHHAGEKRKRPLGEAEGEDVDI